MTQQVETTERDVVIVEDAAHIKVLGFNVLEALPSAWASYDKVDPFILVHESAGRLTPEMASTDTRHPHRGFDNLWYVLQGTMSTGHSTGPGGATERARIDEGSLLVLRTGRGVWHAESIGADEVAEGNTAMEYRSVLFWVNLARKDKKVDPTVRLVLKEEMPTRLEGDAIVRVLVGEGSPAQLGTPALILDVLLPNGGAMNTSVPAEFQGFAYMLDGEASFGTSEKRAVRPQLVLLGPGDSFTVKGAAPGTRFLLMAGKPYGEEPIFNGPFVD